MATIDIIAMITGQLLRTFLHGFFTVAGALVALRLFGVHI